MFYRVIIAVALSLGIAGAAQAQAVNITPLMENECQWDYHNFCGQYAIGSELLDLCFKQNGPKLSKGCVEALIAAGDTTQAYVDRQKELAGRARDQTRECCRARGCLPLGHYVFLRRPNTFN